MEPALTEDGYLSVVIVSVQIALSVRLNKEGREGAREWKGEGNTQRLLFMIKWSVGKREAEL